MTAVSVMTPATTAAMIARGPWVGRLPLAVEEVGTVALMSPMLEGRLREGEVMDSPYGSPAARDSPPAPNGPQPAGTKALTVPVSGS